MQKQIKKIFAFILAFCFVLPGLALAEGEFTLVNRVKNITAGDNPDGAVYTMAQAGDELRYLSIITNNENSEHDYTFSLNFPLNLQYKENSLEKNEGLSWQPANEILQGTNIHLMPYESVFLRFKGYVPTTLPNENLILSVGVEVTNDQNITLSNLTKVYIPNFNPEKEIEIEGATASQKAEIKQIYQEEKEEIEHVFEKNTETENPEKTPENPETPETPETPENPTESSSEPGELNTPNTPNTPNTENPENPEDTNQPQTETENPETPEAETPDSDQNSDQTQIIQIDIFILYIGAAFASLILFYLIYAHARKK